MTWTHDPPTEDGYYWYRCNKFWTPRIVCVQEQNVYYDGVEDYDSVTLAKSRTGSAWCGPLQPPEYNQPTEQTP
jgi:hypothetical protein